MSRHEGSAGDRKEAYGLAILRVVVGAVFLAHGAQKLLVMGVGGLAGFFSQVGIPFPTLSAGLVTGVELLGGLALILGLFTRLAAVPLAITMAVALATVHLPAGFFLPDGYEYVLVLLAATTGVALTGPGALALDNVRSGRNVPVPLRAGSGVGRRVDREAA